MAVVKSKNSCNTMRDRHHSPVRERWEREYDNSKENSIEKQRDLPKHRMKDISRSNRSRVNEGRDSGIERTARREGDRDDRGKDRSKDKARRERGCDSDKHKDKEREVKDRKDRVRVTTDHDGEKEVEKVTGRYKKGEGRGNGSHHEDETSSSKHQNHEGCISSESHPARDLELRISRMREERLQKSEGAAEILTWVSKSRKIGEKGISEKVIKLSRNFEEQDDINPGGRGDDEAFGHGAGVLGGVKILHGLEKVIDGRAVVLTLKDQSILADGDVNQEIDELENVEIGEQNRRDEAYNAAKKKNDVNDDKFNELNTEKRMLPQYDDALGEEWLTLDASGGFSSDAEKKLDDLRKRIHGSSTNNRFEDLNSLVTITSDYYTHEEMLQFKKPRKRKSLRKKEKLDIIDALEADDAISTGLGTGDLGSRKEGKSQAMKIEQDKSEAEMRSNAYKTAYAKAEDASKALRLEQTLVMITEDHDNPVFDDDDNDLSRSLAKARKLALKNRDEAVTSGPKAIAFLASLTANTSTADDQNLPPGEVHENKLVFTEMEEFVWGHHLDNDVRKADGKDVLIEEDVAKEAAGQEIGGWTGVKDNEEEPAASADKDKIIPDEIIHEVAVGKGLSSVLKFLRDRGSLKETVEWGGRNMDKKKSKLVGIYDNDGQNAQKEIRIERRDEYGRIMTPKEAFRSLSERVHGIRPGKIRQEKRMRQYEEEMKVKQMKYSGTPSHSAEMMRQQRTPYLVLSGNVKPGKTSDHRSGFATVDNFP